MNAAVRMVYHCLDERLCIANQPGLRHTRLGVLFACQAPHNTLCVLQPWAANLPLGFEIALELLVGLM